MFSALRVLCMRRLVFSVLWMWQWDVLRFKAHVAFCLGEHQYLSWVNVRTRCSLLQWHIVGFHVGEHQFQDRLNVKARCCHFQGFIVGFYAWGKNESVEGEGKIFSVLMPCCRVFMYGKTNLSVMWMWQWDGQTPISESGDCEGHTLSASRTHCRILFVETAMFELGWMWGPDVFDFKGPL